MNAHTQRRRQRGVTLAIAMLFLVVITLFTVAAFNSTSANQRAAFNMVVRTETMSAAQAVVEETISSVDFTTDPAAVAAVPHPVDVDGDGDPDYTARLNPAPACRRVRTLKTTDLDMSKAADVACMVTGVATLSGTDSPVLAAGVGNSMCANSEWDIRVEVVDPGSGAQTAVTQGVAIRIPATDAADFCN